MKENLDQESLQLIEYVMINDNNKIYFFLVQRIIPVRSMTAVVQVEMQVYIPRLMSERMGEISCVMFVLQVKQVTFLYL